MKKAIKEIRKEFPSNKFYFDDIEKIFNLFKEELGGCKVSTDEYTDITDINDLKELNPKSMDISTNKNGYIRLYINENSTSISAQDTALNRGIIASIDEIFYKTKKKTNILYNFLNGYAILFVIILFVITYSYFNQDYKYVTTTVAFIYFIPFIASLLIKNKNIFILNKTRDNHNFYKENKEWVIPFAAAMFGVLIGKIV